MRRTARACTRVASYEESDDDDAPPRKRRAADEDEDAEVGSETEEDEGEEEEDEDDEYTERLCEAKDKIKQELRLQDAQLRKVVSALHFFFEWWHHDGVAAALRALSVPGMGEEETAAAAELAAAARGAVRLPEGCAVAVFGPLCQLTSGAFQDALLRLDALFELALGLEALAKIRQVKERVAGGAEGAEARPLRLALDAHGVHDDSFVEFFLHQVLERDGRSAAAARLRALVERVLPSLSPGAALRCVVLKLLDAYAEADALRLVAADSAPGARAPRTNTALFDSWRPKGVLDLVERVRGLCFVSVYAATDADRADSWLGRRCELLFDGPAVDTARYYDYRQAWQQKTRYVLPLHAGAYTHCYQDSVTATLKRLMGQGRLGTVVRAAQEVYVACKVTSTLHGLGRVRPEQRSAAKWMKLAAGGAVPHAHWLTPRYELPAYQGTGAKVVTFYLLCNERPPAAYVDGDRLVAPGRDPAPVPWPAAADPAVGDVWRDEDFAPASQFLAAR